MWLLVTLFTAIATLYFICKSFKGVIGLEIKFLALAIWGRYVLSVLNEYTFKPIVAGLSGNALFSILIVILSIFIITNRAFKLKILLPYYLLIFISIISFFNGFNITGLINFIMKWMYFICISLLIYTALKKNGSDKVLAILLKVHTFPLLMQLLSLLLGEVKATENDGSVSVIGGYGHESAFSMISLTILLLSMLYMPFKEKKAIKFLFFSVTSLVLANYRTSLLSAIPLLVKFVFAYAKAKFNSQSRIYIYIYISLLTAVLLVIGWASIYERFTDIFDLFFGDVSLFKNIKYYSEKEILLFSARFYIWNQYIAEFLTGDFFSLLLGNGPNSWEDYFRVYAHNTFVSYLFEYGFFGLSILFYIFILNLIACFKSIPKFRFTLVLGLIGFFILNLMTMPLWNIEGNILYSILVSFSWYYQKGSVSEKN